MSKFELPLSDEERRGFARGVDQFNCGLFFECHDTLEELWTGWRGPARDFLQGLIQVAVAFYHFSGGNRDGAMSLMRRALKRLDRYPDACFGFDLGSHRRELRRWLEAIEDGLSDCPPLDDLPKWRFEWLPPATP